MTRPLLTAVLLLVHVSLSHTLTPASTPYPRMDQGDKNIITAFRAAIPNGNKIYLPLLCDNLRFYCHSNGRIKYIYLAGLKLKGPIPPVIGNLVTLAALFLQANEFNGSIPDSLAKLTNLQFLHLEINQLTGYIPARLTKLPNLIDLTVNANFLAGTPPAFPRLLTLELSNNYFSGILRSSNGAPFCEKLRSNCLRSNPPSRTSLPSNCFEYEQKNVGQCADFCNATQLKGTCGGNGVCVPKMGGGFQCKCFSGFNNRKNKFTCLR